MTAHPCPVATHHDFEVISTREGRPAYVSCRACHAEWAVHPERYA